MWYGVFCKLFLSLKSLHDVFPLSHGAQLLSRCKIFINQTSAKHWTSCDCLSTCPGLHSNMPIVLKRTWVFLLTRYDFKAIKNSKFFAKFGQRKTSHDGAVFSTASSQIAFCGCEILLPPGALFYPANQLRKNEERNHSAIGLRVSRVTFCFLQVPTINFHVLIQIIWWNILLG